MIAHALPFARVLIPLVALASQAQSEPAARFPEAALRAYAGAFRSAGRPPALGTLPAPDGSPAVPGQSLGSGGPTGLQEKTFTASNGKSERFKLVVPSDIGPSKPYGLLLYLHGDGGYDYDWFFEQVQRVAEKNGLIPMAVMAPSQNENGPTWWWDADANARFLDELLKEELLARYNVDRARVIFTGASGGPTFLSGPWIRHFASQYRGGAVLMCGGLVHTSLGFQDAPGFKDNFPLFYENGTSDFLLELAKESMAYYQGQGMKVAGEFPEGAGHCQFNMGQVLGDRVPSILHHASFAR